MKKPTTHVGIVAYENTIDLRRCLMSVCKQTFPNITVTVFDNSSGKKVGKLIRSQFPSVRYFKSAYNSGYGIGHNTIIRGLQHGTDDYYLTLNHDAILDSQYVKNMVKCLEKQNALWGTGKILNIPTKENSQNTIYSVGHGITRNGYFFNIGYGLPDNGTFNKQKEVFGVPGVAAMYSFRLIDRISKDGEFFDPAFFMYSEDTDVDWRARNAGYSCWCCPDAISYHKGGARPSWIIPYAISHRYLSACKNATTEQLMFSVFPVMMIHLILRLFVTPKLGFRTLYILLMNAPSALYKRKANRVISQKDWFTWSKSQPTTQPVMIIERLSIFVGNLFRRSETNIFSYIASCRLCGSRNVW
jgi:GT2 family glycosyltransferase